MDFNSILRDRKTHYAVFVVFAIILLVQHEQHETVVAIFLSLITAATLLTWIVVAKVAREMDQMDEFDLYDGGGNGGMVIFFPAGFSTLWMFVFITVLTSRALFHERPVCSAALQWQAKIFASVTALGVLLVFIRSCDIQIVRLIRHLCPV